MTEGQDTPGSGFGAEIRGFAPGQRVFGRFALKSLAGRGGMGVVWRAWDETLEQDVALKFLPEAVACDPVAVADLKRETRRSLQLTHPNIVRIFDFVQADGLAGISMEYVDGQTLSAIRVARQQPIFTADEILGCLRHICAALDYAHGHARVIHRDMKPANVMVDRRGRVKITDFGIARSISDSASRASGTGKTTSGTLSYMSPQQAMGETPSVSDDIYSLGATVYELLAGKPPFYSGEVLSQLFNVVPPPMTRRRSDLGISGDAIPPAWEEIVAACLEKDADRRPRSAGEVLERLESAATRRAPASVPATKADEKPEAPAHAPASVAPGLTSNPPEVSAVSGTHEVEPPRSRDEVDGILAAALKAILATVLLLAGCGAAGWWLGIEAPRREAARAQAEEQDNFNFVGIAWEMPKEAVQNIVRKIVILKPDCSSAESLTYDTVICGEKCSLQFSFYTDRLLDISYVMDVDKTKRKYVESCLLSGAKQICPDFKFPKTQDSWEERTWENGFTRIIFSARADTPRLSEDEIHILLRYENKRLRKKQNDELSK